MSELRDARHMLEMADRAASDGDLSSADELLRGAARIQEATLGPLHPDLTNTLSNLAIVAERTGRFGDAETFYRRAAAIAAASLPSDHPVVAESRHNLEDFCRDRGLPIAAATVTTPSSPDTAPGRDAVAAPTASQPLPPAAHRSSRQLEWVAIGAIVLVTVAVLARRPWSSRETSAAPTASHVNEPVLTEPALPPPALPAPIDQAQPPTAVPRGENQAVTDKPSAPARPSGAVSLASVQLCQTFSTGGSTWRCDPPGDSVVPGPIVLYTRVRSSSDATVVHRWYHEDMLRQAVKLKIRANASEGYRTYSRQTVDGVGNWRVEVRSAEGNLLHEQRFAAR